MRVRSDRARTDGRVQDGLLVAGHHARADGRRRPRREADEIGERRRQEQIIQEDERYRNDEDREDGPQRGRVDEHPEGKEEDGHEGVAKGLHLDLQPGRDAGVREDHPHEERTDDCGDAQGLRECGGKKNHSEGEEDEHLLALDPFEKGGGVGDHHCREDGEEADEEADPTEQDPDIHGRLGGDDHAIHEGQEEHGEERFEDHHPQEEFGLRVPEPLQVDEGLRGNRGTRHADDARQEDRVDEGPPEPCPDHESREHADRKVCHREDRGGFLRLHQFRDAELEPDKKQEEDEPELRDALQEHAVPEDAIVRPSEDSRVDVRANQHARDDVADDDRHPDPGGDGGPQEADRRNDAHVEHDRRRVNHGDAHPGRDALRVRALTLSTREPRVPSHACIAGRATNKSCQRGTGRGSSSNGCP